jgi:hypothetical protein
MKKPICSAASKTALKYPHLKQSCSIHKETKMKKIFTLILALTIFGFTNIYAHAPSSIDTSIDKSANTITMKIFHNVLKSKNTDPTKHFISPITISVNQKIIAVLKYQKQSDGEFQEVTYKFDKQLNKGDKITINAACILKGSKVSTVLVD